MKSVAPLLAFAGLLLAAPAGAKMWKLLPLGDSITFGCGDYCSGAMEPTATGCNGTYGVGDKCCAKVFGSPVPHPWTPCMSCSGGYRQPLSAMMDAGGPGVFDGDRWEFVGTVKQEGGIHNGAQHDGHPGWRIDQIQVPYRTGVAHLSSSRCWLLATNSYLQALAEPPSNLDPHCRGIATRRPTKPARAETAASSRRGRR